MDYNKCAGILHEYYMNYLLFCMYSQTSLTVCLREKQKRLASVYHAVKGFILAFTIICKCLYKKTVVTRIDQSIILFRDVDIGSREVQNVLDVVSGEPTA